jgi:opine dehydrogenase
LRFAILGAGSAGQGLASYLSIKEHDINLFNRSAGKLNQIRRQGGIEATGVVEGFAKISKATNDIGEAVRDADVIILAVRAFGQKKILELCIPYLKDEQIVLIMTGYWASLRLKDLLGKSKSHVILAETTLLPLVSEVVGPGKVKVTGIKSKMRMAAFPSTRTEETLQSLRDALPQLFAGRDVLETNLENFNPIFHTPIALFNLEEIKRRKDFEFYHQGVTPKIAEVIDSIDREKLNLAHELGLDLGSSLNVLRQYYVTSGHSTYEIVKNCEAWKGYVLPNVFDYIREDVMYGLVPIASLCDLLGLPSKNTREIIAQWSLVDRVNFWEQGVTVERLGLSNMHAEEILQFVSTGKK